MKIDIENVTGALRSLAGRIASWLYVPAAAVIALSLQGCTGASEPYEPIYISTLTVVNESSHTVAVSDWVWAETGSFAVPGTLRLGPGESSEEFFGRTIDGNVREVSLERVTVVYDDVLEIVYGELPKEEYGHSMVAPKRERAFPKQCGAGVKAETCRAVNVTVCPEIAGMASAMKNRAAHYGRHGFV